VLIHVAPRRLIAALPCEGAALRRERQFLSSLDEVVLWRQEGDRLLLTDSEGLPRVELRPTDEVAE
jgi:heat shock protein HslJ